MRLEHSYQVIETGERGIRSCNYSHRMLCILLLEFARHTLKYEIKLQIYGHLQSYLARSYNSTENDIEAQSALKVYCRLMDASS